MKKHHVFYKKTHSNDMDEKCWSNRWGDKIIFSHGTNRWAGVALLLNFPGKILVTNRDSLGHWLICVIEANEFLTLGNIYGYNNLNKEMISEITHEVKVLLQRHPTANFIFGGDNDIC